MIPDPVRAIADAVLYEGYVLWPYRRSALKNTQRWTFGGVFPRSHAEARSAGDDPWTMQTQCLLEGSEDVTVTVGVRFLQVVRRQARDGDGRAVDEVTVAGDRHLTWDEAVERELVVGPARVEDLRAGQRAAISIPAATEVEELPGAGSLERSWEALEGALHVGVASPAAGLHRLTVLIENETPWRGGPREQAQRLAFCSTHTVLHAPDGAFVSLTDPPEALSEAAAACENRGTWPVLAGADLDRRTVLSSPIILADHPQIAPESPGDLFDGGEIDQMLVLQMLSLTDEEREEMRASDPRAREILDRTEALTPEEIMRLNGAIRDFQVRPAVAPDGRASR